MHLTNQESEGKSEGVPPLGAGAPGIEITPAMIQAGEETLLELNGILDSATLATRVFLAMLAKA
jgi:hypothetical protein